MSRPSSIALVNWNNRDCLRGCLESIEAANLPFPVEIVVTDNGQRWNISPHLLSPVKDATPAQPQSPKKKKRLR